MANHYKVLLDTNFVLIPAQFGVDIFVEIERISQFEYEVVVLDRTLYELEKIVKEQRGASKAAAELGLALIKAKDLKIVPTPSSQKDVDARIVDLVTHEKGYIVATQDKFLRDQLKKMHIPIIQMRNKAHLDLDMYT